MDRISGKEIEAWLNSRLSFFRDNIHTFKACNLNVGYPILSLVFAQIEYLSDILYFCPERKSKPTQLVGRYFMEEMSKIDPAYGFKFKREHSLLWGNASNFGELLYLTLRSKIHHQGGAYPPFSVTAEPEFEHLHLNLDPRTSTVIIHAYRLNDDLQGSISSLNFELVRGQRNLERLAKNIDGEKARLEKYKADVTPMIEDMQQNGFFR